MPNGNSINYETINIGENLKENICVHNGHIQKAM